jgi:phosphate transport system permease protein
MTGFYNAIIGTLWVTGLVMLFSTIVGISSAIYLEEYAPKNWFSAFLEVNLRNLAGVPSIVYGLLGLYAFVRWLDLGRSVLAAAMTLTLLILPVVIIAAREALRSVPDSLRQASYGLGATKWQTVSRVILPNAIPGIATGVILAIARAIGDTASILVVGGAGLVTSVPGGWDALTDTFTNMPLQIYTYYSLPNREVFLPVAAAGILVLLAILLVIFALAFYVRWRFAVSR